MIILTSVTFAIACFSLVAIRHSASRAVAEAKATLEKPRWEDFALLEGYYSGLARLVRGNRPEYPPVGTTEAAGDLEVVEEEEAKSMVFDPYPDFWSEEYKSTWQGVYKECSYGVDLSGKKRGRPEVRTFEGIPQGMGFGYFRGRDVG